MSSTPADSHALPEADAPVQMNTPPVDTTGAPMVPPETEKINAPAPAPTPTPAPTLYVEPTHAEVAASMAAMAAGGFDTPDLHARAADVVAGFYPANHDTPAMRAAVRRLLAYGDLFEGGPRQGGAAWLTKKTKTIGGSELSSMLGENHFKSLYSLMAGKIGLERFEASAATRWGNTFEEVAQLYAEQVFATRVLCTVVHLQGPVDHQTYSPDGLGVVSAALLDTVAPPAITPAEGGAVAASAGAAVSTVLFEFKCPYSRIPYRDKPPKCYVPQVLAGLGTIGIADVGVLAEFVIRACSVADFGFNPQYNASGEATRRVGAAALPLALGVICFRVADRAAYAAAADAEGMAEPCGADLGRLPLPVIDVLFELGMAGALVAEYLDPVSVADTAGAAAAAALLLAGAADFNRREGAASAGYLPYKIFDAVYHRIEREPGFLAQHAPQIKKIITRIDECNKLGDIASRKMHLDDYFSVEHLFDY